MVGRRMMFAKFRKWFEPCFNDPLRLSGEQFRGLLLEMFGQDFDDADVMDVMTKLGFTERKNIKGSFYIRPKLEFYLEADRKHLINRIISLCHQRN